MIVAAIGLLLVGASMNAGDYVMAGVGAALAITGLLLDLTRMP